MQPCGTSAPAPTTGGHNLTGIPTRTAAERDAASSASRRATRSSTDDGLQFTWQGVGTSLAFSLIPAGSCLRRRTWVRIRSRSAWHRAIRPRTALSCGPACARTCRSCSLGRRAIPVGWRVATDSEMHHVVARGTAVASPELAHSVHVEVDGLKPGRDYFYQFDLRDEESPVGHFRTAPAQHEMAGQIRFAFATCQDWPSGYHTAYRDMVENDLDVVLHLGDYTYEYAIGNITGRGSRRRRLREETVDLRTYRLRHTLYKLDPDLQAAHAKFPFAVIWDDHEVANDYSGLAPEYGRRRRNSRRGARPPTRPTTSTCRSAPRCPASRVPGLQIYRQFRFGRLAEFTMLDDRQYRTDNPCGDGEALRCDEALTGDYTMLGREQERWLARNFRECPLVGTSSASSCYRRAGAHAPGYPDEWYWNDAWDGYPLARQRLLDRRRESSQQSRVPDRRLALDVCQ